MRTNELISVETFDRATAIGDKTAICAAYLETVAASAMVYIYAPKGAKANRRLEWYIIPTTVENAAVLASMSTITRSSNGQAQVKFGEGSHKSLKAAAARHIGGITRCELNETIADLDAIAQGATVTAQINAAKERLATAKASGNKTAESEARNAVTAYRRGIAAEVIAARIMNADEWTFDGERYDRADDVAGLQVKVTRGTERLETIRAALVDAHRNVAVKPGVPF